MLLVQLTKDGKYNADGLYDLAKMSYQKDPDKLEKAKKVVDTCSKEGEYILILKIFKNMGLHAHY